MTMARWIDGWRRRGALLLVTGALAACGGGSGGGGDGGGTTPQPTEVPTGPPSTAATLADTSTDATDVTQAAVAAADGLVDRNGSLSGLSALLGAPVTGAAPGVGVSLVRHDRMRAQAVTTAGCAEVVDAPCSGSATIDTDIPDTATSVAVGQYIDVTFDAIAGSLFGQSIALDGRIRIEFLTAFSENTQSIAGLGLRVQADALTVSSAGVSYGPVSEVADIRFDANAQPSIVIDGARYGALSSVTVTGQGTYTIGSGSARLGYGSAKSTYVNVNLSGWSSNAGRPQEGSSATVTVPNWRATVTVVSSTGSVVEYDVEIRNTSTGATGGYRVTATYPAGGGAPTYAAVAS